MDAKDEDKTAGGAVVVQARSLLRNVAGLLTGRLIGDIATFLLFVLLSRQFGEEGIGQYSFATAVGGFAWTVSEFGLRGYALKEIGRHRDAARDRYWQLAASWLLNVLIVFAVLVPVTLLMSISAEAKAVLILIIASQLFLSLVSGAGTLFMAHEKMEIGALFESLANWLVAVAAIVVTLLGGSLVTVSASIAAAYGLATVIGVVVLFRWFRIEPRGFSFKGYWQLLREAFPFAMRQILRQVSLRMDILLIGLLLGPVEVGAYAVAYRLIFIIYILFHIVGLAIMPASSRFYKDERGAFLQLVQRALGVVILIAVPAAVGLALVATDVVLLVFGPEFDTSAGLLQGLAILVAFFPLGLIMQNLMEAADRQVATMYTEVIGVVTGFLAQIALIPLYGLPGAVAAVIFGEICIVAAAAYGVRDIADWPRLAGRAAIALLGSAAFAALFFLFPQVDRLFLIVPAMVVYAAVLFCFRGLYDEELGGVIGLLRKVLERRAA